MPKKRSDLLAFAKAVNKKQGGGTIASASNVRALGIPRIPTGSLALDLALGGGFPAGRIGIFFGHESGGKTTNLLRMMGQAQALCSNCLRPAKALQVHPLVDDTGEQAEGNDDDGMYFAEAECDCYASGAYLPKRLEGESVNEFQERLVGLEENSYEEMVCAFVDAEGTYDPEWGARLGVDNRRLVYYRPNTAEEAIDVADSMLRTGGIDLMGIDSLAEMTPSKETEVSVEEWQQGLHARLINKMFRKLASTMSTVAREKGRPPTLLCINQIRQKIGISYGDNSTLPGGMGQRFAASVMVKFWTSDFDAIPQHADLKSGQEKAELAYACRTHFLVQKNKTAAPRAVGSYRMFLKDDGAMVAGAVDELDFVIDYAVRVDLTSKAKYTLGTKDYKTKTALREALRDDPALLWRLKMAIISWSQKS